MKLHSTCTLSFRGRCNIWFSSPVTFSGRRNICRSCIQVAHLVFVAGAIFGAVQLSLLVAGAIFDEIWNARGEREK